MIKNNMPLKIGSLFLLVCFLAQIIFVDAQAAEVFTSNAVSSSRAQAGQFENAIFNLPQEFGKLDSKWISQAKPQGPYVVHIQDAHANSDAQKNIFRILRYLEQKFPDIRIGLENAEGRLHPEYLEFFKDAPWVDVEIMRSLTEKGEVTGAELFLWRKMKQSEASEGLVWGVENRDLHRKNVSEYRELLAMRDEIQTLLVPLSQKLSTLTSQKMSPPLAEFVRERERRRHGRFEFGKPDQSPDLIAYVDYLRRQASDRLGVSLSDSLQQFEFPQLVRLMLLSQVQKEIDLEKARAEWGQLVRVLDAKEIKGADLSWLTTLKWVGFKNGFLNQMVARPRLDGVSESLLQRFVFEDAIRIFEENKINLSMFSEWARSFKLIVFGSEIEVNGLMQEVNQLEERLIVKLAVSEEDKKWIQKSEEFFRFEKLLRLEIDRADYQKIVSDAKNYRAIATVHPRLLEAFEKANLFYQTAEMRERGMVQNLLHLTSKASQENSEVLRHKQKKNKNSPEVVVFVSGGFHSEGVQALLQEKQISYAVLTPAIHEVHAGQYEDVMAEKNGDLSPWFSGQAPFRGGAAVLFREFLQTGVPQYLQKSLGVATQISSALKEHPLFSKPYDYEMDERKGRLGIQIKPQRTIGSFVSNAVFKPLLISDETARATALQPLAQQGLRIDLGQLPWGKAFPDVRRAEVNLGGGAEKQQQTALSSKVRSEVRMDVTSIGGLSVHGRMVFQSTRDFTFDHIIQPDERAQAQEEFHQWIEEVKKDAEGYMTTPFWAVVENVFGSEQSKYLKYNFQDYQTHHPIAQFIAGVSQEIKSLRSRLGQAGSLTKKREIGLKLDAFVQLAEVLEIKSRLWRLYRAENLKTDSADVSAGEADFSPSQSTDVFETVRKRVIERRMVENENHIREIDDRARLYIKLIERNADALEVDTQAEIDHLRGNPENDADRVQLEKALKEFRVARRDAWKVDKVTGQAAVNSKTGESVEESWTTPNRLEGEFVPAFFRIKELREKVNSKIASQTTATGTAAEVPLENLVNQLLAAYSERTLNDAYSFYLLASSELDGLMKHWSEEGGHASLVFLGKFINRSKKRIHEIRAKYPDKQFSEELNDLIQWKESLFAGDPFVADLNTYITTQKSIATFTDAQGMLRSVLLEIINELENEVLNLPKDESDSTESEQDQTIDDLGLLVTRMTTIEEIDRDLKKYRGQIKFIITTVGGRNTHWVNLLRGRRNAPEIIFLDAGRYQEQIEGIQPGDLVVTVAGDQGLELHLQPDLKTIKRANQEFNRQEIERSMRRRVAPDVNQAVYINLEAGNRDLPTEDHPAGAGLIRSDVVSEAMRSYWSQLSSKRAVAKNIQASLKAAWDIPSKESAWAAIQDRLGTDYGRAMSHLFREVKDSLEPLLVHPFLAGKDYSFRTIDLQNDSKNQEAYQLVKKDYPENEISGFYFYRNTDIGRAHLVTQIAALFVIYAERFDGRPSEQVPKLNIFPPMVASQDDVNYFFNEILPEAKALAANMLWMNSGGEAEPMQVNTQIERIAVTAHYGVMVEVPELIQDPELRKAIIQDSRISFYSMGTNDLELAFWQKTLGEAHLSRESPASEFIFGKLHPEMMKALNDFVMDVKRFASQKKIKFCGAMAARRELIASITHWQNQGILAYSSVNAADLAAVRTDFMFMSQPRMSSALAVFNQDIASGTMNEIQLNRKFSAMILEHSEYLKNVQTLIEVEKWQKHYIDAGGLHSLQHLDLDVVNGVGSAVELETLLNIAKAHGWVEPGFQAGTRNQREKLLSILFDQHLIYEKEREELLEAWEFLGAVHETYQQLSKQNTAYRGDLHPEILPDFLEHLKNPNIQNADEFYNQYFTHARAVFESSTRILHDVMAEILKPNRVEYETTNLPDNVLQVARPILDRFPQIKIRERHGMTFSTEAGFNYREYIAIYLEGESQDSAPQDPAVISALFELSAVTGFRISHRTQKKLRQVSATELPDAWRLRNALSAPRSVAYAITRAHRFHVLDRLISGYNSQQDRFEGLEHPFSDYTLMQRALEAMEALPDQKSYAYQRVRQVYENLRSVPDRIFVLRSAVLLNHLVVNAVRDIPIKHTQIRWKEMVEVVGDILKKAVGPNVSNRQELVRQITWLIYHQTFLAQSHFLTADEMYGALRNIIFSSGFKSSSGSEETVYLFDMLYVMSYAMRMGEVEDEKRELVVRSGPESRFANLDKIYLAGQQVLKGERDPESERDLVDALQRANQFVREDGVPQTLNSNQTWVDQLLLLEPIRPLESETIMAAAGEYIRSQGLSRSEADQILEVLRDSERLGLYRFRYQALLSPYYLNGLTAEELARQLVFFVHLDLLARVKQHPRLAFTASVVSQRFNSAYELLFGIPHDHRGTLNAIVRVLFENQFHLEALSFHFEEGKEQGFVRVLGYVPHDTRKPEATIRQIYLDAKETLSPEQSFREEITSLSRGLFDREAGDRARLVQERLKRKYGTLKIPPIQLTWRGQKASVQWLDSRRLVIQATDRFGLTAAVTELIANGFKLTVDDVALDDLHGRFPRLFLTLSEAQNIEIPQEKKKAVSAETEAMLDYPGSLDFKKRQWTQSRAEARVSPFFENDQKATRSEARSPDVEEVLRIIRERPEAYAEFVTPKIAQLHGEAISEILDGVLELLEQEKGRVTADVRWTAARLIWRLIKQEPSLAEGSFGRMLNFLIDDDSRIRPEIEQALFACARSKINLAQLKINGLSGEIVFVRTVQEGEKKGLYPDANEYAMNFVEGFYRAAEQGWEKPDLVEKEPAAKEVFVEAPDESSVAGARMSLVEQRVKVFDATSPDGNLHTSPQTKIADLAAHVRQQLGVDIYLKGENISDENGRMNIFVAGITNNQQVSLEIKPSPGRTAPTESVIAELLSLWEEFLTNGNAFNPKTNPDWADEFQRYQSRIDQLAVRSELRPIPSEKVLTEEEKNRDPEESFVYRTILGKTQSTGEATMLSVIQEYRKIISRAAEQYKSYFSEKQKAELDHLAGSVLELLDALDNPNDSFHDAVDGYVDAVISAQQKESEFDYRILLKQDQGEIFWGASDLEKGNTLLDLLRNRAQAPKTVAQLFQAGREIDSPDFLLLAYRHTKQFLQVARLLNHIYGLHGRKQILISELQLILEQETTRSEARGLTENEIASLQKLYEADAEFAALVEKIKAQAPSHFRHEIANAIQKLGFIALLGAEQGGLITNYQELEKSVPRIMQAGKLGEEPLTQSELDNFLNQLKQIQTEVEKLAEWSDREGVLLAIAQIQREAELFPYIELRSPSDWVAYESARLSNALIHLAETSDASVSNEMSSFLNFIVKEPFLAMFHPQSSQYQVLRDLIAENIQARLDAARLEGKAIIKLTGNSTELFTQRGRRDWLIYLTQRGHFNLISGLANRDSHEVKRYFELIRDLHSAGIELHRRDPDHPALENFNRAVFLTDLYAISDKIIVLKHALVNLRDLEFYARKYGEGFQEAFETLSQAGIWNTKTKKLTLYMSDDQEGNARRYRGVNRFLHEMESIEREVYEGAQKSVEKKIIWDTLTATRNLTRYSIDSRLRHLAHFIKLLQDSKPEGYVHEGELEEAQYSVRVIEEVTRALLVLGQTRTLTREDIFSIPEAEEPRGDLFLRIEMWPELENSGAASEEIWRVHLQQKGLSSAAIEDELKKLYSDGRIISHGQVLKHGDEFEVLSAKQRDTVLLIEDEEAIQRLLTFALAGAGFRVLPAKNKKEAAQLYENNRGRIFLISSDYNLGGGENGVDTVKNLLGDEASQEIKVLFLSGRVEEVEAHLEKLSANGQALEADVLGKPIQISYYLAQVRQANPHYRSELRVGYVPRPIDFTDVAESVRLLGGVVGLQIRGWTASIRDWALQWLPDLFAVEGIQNAEMDSVVTQILYEVGIQPVVKGPVVHATLPTMNQSQRDQFIKSFPAVAAFLARLNGELYLNFSGADTVARKLEAELVQSSQQAGVHLKNNQLQVVGVDFSAQPFKSLERFSGQADAIAGSYEGEVRQFAHLAKTLWQIEEEGLGLAEQLAIILVESNATHLDHNQWHKPSTYQSIAKLIGETLMQTIATAISA